jgi:hypothetical protein
MLPPVRYSRGILIPVRDDLEMHLAWHLVSVLRSTGCTLPIEVWITGANRTLPEIVATALLPLGATVIEAEAYRPEPREGGKGVGVGWLAAMALRYSGCAEVILIEPDVVPATDPTSLLSDLTYERRGLMLWPTREPRGSLTVPAAIDSGVMLVNRKKHLAALDLCVTVNEWADYCYRFLCRPDDSIVYATSLTGGSWYTPARGCVTRGLALCQHDSKGELSWQRLATAREALAAGKIFGEVSCRRHAPDAAASLAAVLSGENTANSRENLGFSTPHP